MQKTKQKTKQNNEPEKQPQAYIGSAMNPVKGGRIDIGVSEEYLKEQIQEVKEENNLEEYIIADSEFTAPFDPKEGTDLHKLNKALYKLREKFNYTNLLAVSNTVDLVHEAGDLSEGIDDIINFFEKLSFRGPNKDKGDIGQELFEVYFGDELPSIISTHVDWEMVGEEFIMSHNNYYDEHTGTLIQVAR